MPSLVLMIVLIGFVPTLRDEGVASVSQDADPRVEAIRSVIWFRTAIMGSTIPFDGCSLFRKTGEPSGLSELIRPALREFVRGHERPCQSPAELDSFVVIDTIAVADSTAIVQLRVHRPEVLFRETYRLRITGISPPGLVWGIRDVTVWGAIRFQPVRR